MSDWTATALVSALMIVLVTIPVLTLRFSLGRTGDARAEIETWAERRGLVRTQTSALPPALARAYPSAVSFDWRGGALAVHALPYRGAITTTIWARPVRGPTSGGVHARRRGLATSAAGELRASGDGPFDAAFEVHGASAAAVSAILDADVRRALLATPDLETFEWDGARWSITLRGRSWERGRALVEQVASRV